MNSQSIIVIYKYYLLVLLLKYNKFIFVKALKPHMRCCLSYFPTVTDKEGRLYLDTRKLLRASKHVELQKYLTLIFWLKKDVTVPCKQASSCAIGSHSLITLILSSVRITEAEPSWCEGTFEGSCFAATKIQELYLRGLQNTHGTSSTDEEL